MTALAKTADAQANMQEQFDRHKCNREDAQPKPRRTLSAQAAAFSLKYVPPFTMASTAFNKH
jgi:hypothetical protein